MYSMRLVLSQFAHAVSTDNHGSHRVISVLDGRDRLLSGEYQDDLKRIHEAMLADGMEPPKN